VIGYDDPFVRTANIAGVNDATGAVLWRTKLGSAAYAGGTALWQNFVLAAASDGNLYALDRATGSVAWNIAGLDTGASVPPSLRICTLGPMAQPMLVVRNSLFVSTTTGAMVMIDLTSRTLLHRTAPVAGPSAGNRMLADSSAVYVASALGVLTEYSTADAHLLRAVALASDQVCGVALAAGKILATGVLGVYALSR